MFLHVAGGLILVAQYWERACVASCSRSVRSAMFNWLSVLFNVQQMFKWSSALLKCRLFNFQQYWHSSGCRVRSVHCHVHCAQLLHYFVMLCHMLLHYCVVHYHVHCALLLHYCVMLCHMLLHYRAVR